MSNQTHSTKQTFLGMQAKTWTQLVWGSVLGIISIFIVLPFLISLFLPIIVPNYGEKFNYLVDLLDGVSIVLALFGTFASVLSIVMTLADKKRYAEEKEDTKELINSVNVLHSEIGIVDSYVKKTFEQNQMLRLELYHNKSIQNNSTDDWEVSVNNIKASNIAWEKKSESGEIENE